MEILAWATEVRREHWVDPVEMISAVGMTRLLLKQQQSRNISVETRKDQNKEEHGNTFGCLVTDLKA